MTMAARTATQRRIDHWEIDRQADRASDLRKWPKLRAQLKSVVMGEIVVLVGVLNRKSGGYLSGNRRSVVPEGVSGSMTSFRMSYEIVPV